MLTLSTFAIGTAEFVVMGLLTSVAQTFAVSVPAAGGLVSGYALGFAIGGPVLALGTARLPRKQSLLLLMGVFALANALCAIAPSFHSLLIGRVVTGVVQGAFFGIGAVVASSMVVEERRASAVALMLAGVSLANVFGVPLGTALGQWAGWRTPFWVISALGLVALAGLWRGLPSRHDEERLTLAGEFRALWDRGVGLGLLTTALFSTSIFVVFTYVEPMLAQLAGLSASGVTLTLLTIGAGLTLGTYIGGRLADWNLSRALIVIALAMAVVSLALRWSGQGTPLTEALWFMWGAATFSVIAPLQVFVVRLGHRAPNLVSTLVFAAFNVGIAFGARVGGGVLAAGYSLADLPVTAFLIALLAFLVASFAVPLLRRRERVAASVQSNALDETA